MKPWKRNAKLLYEERIGKFLVKMLRFTDEDYFVYYVHTVWDVQADVCLLRDILSTDIDSDGLAIRHAVYSIDAFLNREKEKDNA